MPNGTLSFDGNLFRRKNSGPSQGDFGKALRGESQAARTSSGPECPIKFEEENMDHISHWCGLEERY